VPGWEQTNVPVLLYSGVIRWQTLTASGPYRSFRSGTKDASARNRGSRGATARGVCLPRPTRNWQDNRGDEVRSRRGAHGQRLDHTCRGGTYGGTGRKDRVDRRRSFRPSTTSKGTSSMTTTLSVTVVRGSERSGESSRTAPMDRLHCSRPGP